MDNNNEKGKIYKCKLTSDNSNGYYSLNELINKFSFIIPSYQRPLSWKADNVKILLEDLTKNEEHFIGNIIVKKSTNNKYYVIDGQQRLTVIYLLAYLASKGIFDLSYEVRDEDEKFLKELKENEENKENKEKTEDKLIERLINKLEENKNISENFRDIVSGIKDFLDNKNDDNKKISKLFERIIFTITVLPDIEPTDYFIKMNMRGKQLDPIDIIRAKIFQKLVNLKNEDNKQEYKDIFDICRDMEHNILLDKFEKKNGDDNKNKTDNEEKIKKNLEEIREEIREILSDDKQLWEYFKSLNKKEEKLQTKKATIKFSHLLLHTLKLYLKLYKNDEKNDTDIPLNDSKIWDTFNQKFFEKLTKDNDTEEVKKFLTLLLKNRIIYDLFSVYYDKDENNYKIFYFEYLKEENEKYHQLILLQQLLNIIDSSVGKNWLEKLFTFSYNENDLLEKLIEELEEFDRNKEKEFKEEKLNQGVNTPHKWFYRAEYISWKEININNNSDLLNEYKEKEKNNIFIDKDLDKYIKTFYIRQQNSIEHIYPRSSEVINKFGNLALISKGLNSKLSDHTLKEKFYIYKNHIEQYKSITSLQLYLAFALLKNNTNDDAWNEKWKNELLNKHHENLINILKNNYLNTNENGT